MVGRLGEHQAVLGQPTEHVDDSLAGPAATELMDAARAEGALGAGEHLQRDGIQAGDQRPEWVREIHANIVANCYFS